MKNIKLVIIITFIILSLVLMIWGDKMNTNEMIDSFIEQSNNSELELKNARYSSLKEKNYQILRQRLDENELDLKTLKDNIDKLEQIINSFNLKNKRTFHASKFISKLKNGESATVVFLGDSTTEQNITTNGQLNHVGLLQNWLQNIYGENVTVINAGISGNNIKQMWQRVWKDVLVYEPDLIIINSALNDQGGTNAISLDEYKSNYNMIIKEILAQTECDIILRTPNVTQNPTTNTALEDFNNATYAIAEKYNLGMFDLFSEMKQDIESGNIILADLMHDGIHPNEFGHEYIFEKFKDYFIPTKYVQKPNYNYRMLSAKGGINLSDTGAILVEGVHWMNGNVLVFNNPNTDLEFEFIGNEFSIISVGAPSTGQYKVFIDNIEQPIFDTYGENINYRLFDTYKVDLGKHIVKIRNLETKNSNSTSTNLQIQGIIFKTEISQLIRN